MAGVFTNLYPSDDTDEPDIEDIFPPGTEKDSRGTTWNPSFDLGASSVTAGNRQDSTPASPGAVDEDSSDEQPTSDASTMDGFQANLPTIYENEVLDEGQELSSLSDISGFSYSSNIWVRGMEGYHQDDATILVRDWAVVGPPPYQEYVEMPYDFHLREKKRGTPAPHRDDPSIMTRDFAVFGPPKYQPDDITPTTVDIEANYRRTVYGQSENPAVQTMHVAVMQQQAERHARWMQERTEWEAAEDLHVAAVDDGATSITHGPEEVVTEKPATGESVTAETGTDISMTKADNRHVLTGKREKVKHWLQLLKPRKTGTESIPSPKTPAFPMSMMSARSRTVSAPDTAVLASNDLPNAAPAA